MKDLIEMAMALRDDFHDFKEKFIRESRKLSDKLEEEWVDGQRVMDILKISKRTLQNLRDHGDLGYSIVKGKFYYKAEDLEELLQSNYLKKKKKDRCRRVRISRIGDELTRTGEMRDE